MKTERTEREMAMEIQQRKKELLALLPAKYHETTKGTGSSGPETFEEKTIELIRMLRSRGTEEDACAAAGYTGLLAAFRDAVNVYWTWAVVHGLPEALSAEWRKKHRTAGQAISKEDVEAEVMFEIRRFIVLFDPRGEERLFSYAYRGMLQHLTEWSVQQGPLQVPQKAARVEKLKHMRVPYVDERHGSHGAGAFASQRDGVWRQEAHAAAAYDPWAAVDAYLDGEIGEEDL